MSLSHTAPVQTRFTLLVFVALAFSSAPALTQTSDSDGTMIQPTTGSTNARGRETQHHEAGSVEASAPAMKDRLFLRKAAVGGMLEIQLSKLALQKTSGQDVRQVAGQIIADHTRINGSLQSEAESQGIMLPTRLPPREQAVYDSLSSLSGEDFDRQYIRIVVEEHHKDLRDFRSEAASTPDDGLRSALQDAAKMIHEHMAVADQIARTRGVQVTRPAKVNASTTPR